MSLSDFRESAHAFRELMRQAEREIQDGQRKGATVLYRKANPAKTVIGWFKRRLLRGEFRRRA